MQFKFVSLGLVAVVLMTAVSAKDTVSVTDTNVDVHGVATDILDCLEVTDIGNNLNANVASKRSVMMTAKNMSTAARRRALARRTTEEEDAEEEESLEEETEETAEEDAEESTEEDVEEDAEGETEENTEEDDDIEMQRRDVIGSVPVVGGLLGGKGATKGGLLG